MIDLYIGIAGILMAIVAISVIFLSSKKVEKLNQRKAYALDKRNTAVINIGDEKTEVTIFKKGIAIESENIDIGAKSIERDICYIYDIDRRTAKKLKENNKLFIINVPFCVK